MCISSTLLFPSIAVADTVIPPGYIASPDALVVTLAMTVMVAAVVVPSFLLLRRIARTTTGPHDDRNGDSQSSGEVTR